ncbi:hypothetical protein B0T21DRAFT_362352 [Apiosordaria backusii]|uniref:Uncharacterized protein n=1 Tax=Apiosordaria backusii TaxID=314023 RepID=A0AA40EGN2_9PEZI|nr:hypothetical protein B0T21DRAFT_362352 [Apiosordaria backusii]
MSNNPNSGSAAPFPGTVPGTIPDTVPVDPSTLSDEANEPHAKICLIKMTWNWNTVDSCFLAES